MKKLIQISIIAILVVVLFQAAVVAPVASSGQMGSSAASHMSSTATMPVEGAQMATCLVRIKGVVCAIPKVGWNS